MRIGINCGHTVSGTIGCGAVGSIDESDETRRVGYALMQICRDAGHTVVDCTNDRASSVSENLSEICRLANAQPLDLFVSIHFNSGGGRGTEVFTYGAKAFDEAVNTCKQIAALGFNNRGVKDGSNLYVVHRTDAKAMLVECCFVDTDDADKYKSLGCERMAQAIFAGITGGKVATPTVTPTQDTTPKPQTLSLEEQVKELQNEITKIKNALGGTFVYNYNDSNVPAWAKEALGKAIKSGILTGDGSGLDLNEKDLRTIVREDRCGLYDTTPVYRTITDLPSWYTEAAQWAVDNGLIVGDGESLNLTDEKAWFLTVLYRAFKKHLQN